MTRVIRLCVVDDHMVVRDGVRAMAEREPDLEFAGGIGTIEGALDLVTRERPDVLLLDLRIGDQDSFDVCRQITESGLPVKVLLFTAYGNAQLLTQSIRAGAGGYVLKDTNTSRLPDILREFVETGTYFDPRIAGRMLVSTLRPPHAPRQAERTTEARLNERELAIIRMIANGDSNYDIADALHLSPNTIKFHITGLLRRFDVRRRAELVRVASDMHLLGQTRPFPDRTGE